MLFCIPLPNADPNPNPSQNQNPCSSPLPLDGSTPIQESSSTDGHPRPAALGVQAEGTGGSTDLRLDGGRAEARRRGCKRPAGELGLGEGAKGRRARGLSRGRHRPRSGDGGHGEDSARRSRASRVSSRSAPERGPHGDLDLFLPVRPRVHVSFLPAAVAAAGLKGEDPRPPCGRRWQRPCGSAARL